MGVHVFRASWQSAFRNPSPDQLFGIAPRSLAGEVGGMAVAYRAAGLDTNRAYRQTDAVVYQRAPTAANAPQPLTVSAEPMRTEKVSTWEVGYKALINGKLAIDGAYFSSHYTDLITPELVYQPLSATAGVSSLLTPTSYRTLLLNRNSPNDFFVRGPVSVSITASPGATRSAATSHIKSAWLPCATPVAMSATTGREHRSYNG
ncbi:TonB-dependent receptor domain-containing protein [Spirosoma rhododendri]|uniref:TonB-dependent receptor domain-containing protein n=1 Tax=Spirosoma rhododendri TaxID=2728024 RepID=UPI0020C3280E|nr:TonB-dependent receptor [Spirosoma rhododendri]